MMIYVLFAVLFGAGPLIYRRLTQKNPSRRGQIVLIILALGFVSAGLALRYGADAIWGQHLGLTVMVLCLIWLAWVAVLAFGAQALRLVDDTRLTRRWTHLVGSAGTTVPWFGLAFAAGLAG